MIRKIGACLMAFAVAVSFQPVAADAASSSKKQKQKIKKYFKQLKKLPNKAAPTGKVKSLTQKLAKLDPKKANTYMKQATKKFIPEVRKTQSEILGSNVIKIVDNSDLPQKQKDKVVNNVEKTVIKVEPDATPTPTPGPYQASIGSVGALA